MTEMKLYQSAQRRAQHAGWTALTLAGCMAWVAILEVAFNW